MKTLLCTTVIMMFTCLSSFQAYANVSSKYPAYDFEPKIIYQSEEIKNNAADRIIRDNGPSFADLLLILVFIGLCVFIYKSRNTVSGTVNAFKNKAAVAKKSVPIAETQPETRTQRRRDPSKVYGYRSKRDRLLR